MYWPRITSFGSIGIMLRKTLFLLGARTDKGRAHRKVDAAGLREAQCQAWEERCHGCGGDLRGGHPSEHAVCAGQERRPFRAHVRILIEQVFGEDIIDLPALARIALRPRAAQLMELRLQIRIKGTSRLASDKPGKPAVETIPGVGFITATAIAGLDRAGSFRLGWD